MVNVSRRRFLQLGAGTVAGLSAAALVRDRAFLETIPNIENPLAFYPNRGWEKFYRDLFKHDSEFVFLCAPNDTHNCLLTARVKQGVITRIEPTYRYGDATDVYGNRASHRWDPRACQKGLGLARRFYGDRRVKGALVRKGYLDWVSAGRPRDPVTGVPPAALFQRGTDEWVKVTFDQAYEMVAASLVDIARTYNGPEGQERLRKQGYDEDMIETQKGHGTQVLKFRGGMPFLGATRLMGFYRIANSMALLDAQLSRVGPDEAVGGRVFDSYTWHTDLPPGHPLVTGQQTVEFDLFTAENARLITLWGMNWIATKMVDSHWLTEARLRGSKVVCISVDYQSTANKADEVVIIRPGTDAALALGMCRVIMDELLYDEAFVNSFTDLPLLVRMDNLKLLRAADLSPGYQPAQLDNYTRVFATNQAPDPILVQGAQQIPEALRNEWGDAMVWDRRTNHAQVVSRDQVGARFQDTGLDPALEGTFTVTTVNGETVEVRPQFALLRDYLKDFDPRTVSEITRAPQEAVVSLARQIAANPAATLLTTGVGPNHFFNADLKDRAIFLLGALTNNIGHLGGSPGAFAGNYRTANFNGLPQFILEDPFNPVLDPARPVATRSYAKAESAHYYNYGDRPLRMGNKNLTGKTHMPTPTKSLWFANSNSMLGNAKGAYDVIHNTLPKIETVVVNEWWWTMSCDYADVVFGVDSWAEFKQPDMAGSVTNPFVSVFPRTPLPRIFDTVGDIDVLAGVGKALASATGDRRFEDMWRFVYDGRVDVYLQRIVDASNSLAGFRFADLEDKAKQGIPSLAMYRTYPRVNGWEQTQENKPWYTKTGRLEFYRDEDEFIEYGENLLVYREPIDATFYEPNVIVGSPHPAIRPAGPAQYGVRPDDLSVEVRQGRNVLKRWEELKGTRHPQTRNGMTHLFITPKYRHGAHTTPVDSDTSAQWFGPFTDIYRRDKRQPWVSEAYVDINPVDAKALGIEDGDYVWIDADPEDRPYRGWKPTDPDYRVARMMCRARYYSGILPGVLRMFYNMYQASHGTVEAHEGRADGLAKNPRSNYQAMFRYGGHQSATRAWLRPTMLTDSVVRKEVFGQLIGKGFAPDVYCANGAPKESFVRISKAENGGLDGVGLWRPAQRGLRPTYESPEMLRYLRGGFFAST
ncbi:MAG: molybdopterin-dependent oxidoreductase [Chloroflexi bacterium]|nr:molybdopterin-dependent oxidoreductase [Chloroflexota bacterium]